MRKATDQRDAQTISLLWTSLLLFHGGDVTCFDACHVIWCGGHVIWCDVIACVVSCHVMQCDVMWCALMWCALQWSRCVFEVVLWRCGDPKYYSVLQSTTVYYKVLLQYYSVLQSTTPVLLCTTKYYSSTTLYYKAAFMIDPWHIWTVIYIARSNRSHPPTSPNTAPATQNDCDDWSAFYNARSNRNHNPTSPNTAPHQIWNVIYNARSNQSHPPTAAIILRLPRKVTLMIAAPHIWNVIYNARSNTGVHPTSPNTAPAMKFWIQDVNGTSLNCFRQ